MSQEPIYDQRVLREDAYADDSLLEVRARTHRLYTVDPVDFGRWTLERLSWRGDERVLDVGCGPGGLLVEMARQHDGWGMLAGLDFSPGMIARAASSAAGLSVQWSVGDAQALPFRDGCFDVVMARHMLYHVPDIGRAVAEAARVLWRPEPATGRAGGRFLAVTNSTGTMPEYWDLRRAAADRFPGAVLPQGEPHRFSLENGASILASHFDRVETHTLPGTLRFPSVQPLVEYFASTRALTMQPEHTESEWQAVLDFVRAAAQAVIDREGKFDVTKITGAIVGIQGG